MNKVVDFTLVLVKELVENKDAVKVNNFTDDDGTKIIGIVLDSKDMGYVIGKNGQTAKSIRTLVQAYASNNGIKRIRVNIDTI